MNAEYKLTVAIPTFDRETYLAQVLESLERQTELSFRVMLFDNASPYDINKLIGRFPHLAIELIRSETNQGNQANFARVMTHTFDTPYVMVFHDDDAIHPDYFQHALPILDGDLNLNWVGSHINYTNREDQMLEFKDAPNPPRLKLYTKAELADAFMAGSRIGFSSVIYRSEALARTRLAPERFHKWMDRPFMLEAIDDGRAGVLEFPYINYRIHPGQDSAQPYKDHLPEMVNLIEYFHDAGKTRNKAHAVASALRTAAVNARSVRDFFAILGEFKDRGLYSTDQIRPRALIWVLWLLYKRLRSYLLKR